MKLLQRTYNKASQAGLRKLSSFLQKYAKKQPIHSGSCWRRYVSELNMKIFLIFTESEILISKKHYEKWEDIQDKYSDYSASLGPWPIKEVVDYLEFDYPKLSPSADEQLANLVNGNVDTLKLSFSDSIAT
ncbi:hypothetical protein [Motilimonas cestriensis]|uniref:hypothetical protein n=1 Tax=Motilimonas cestriensis TaxID=2742685 RepID=UPI003DA5F1B3